MSTFTKTFLPLFLALSLNQAPLVMAADPYESWTDLMFKGNIAKNARDNELSAKYFKAALDYADNKKLPEELVERSLILYSIVIKRAGHKDEGQAAYQRFIRLTILDAQAHRKPDYVVEEYSFKVRKYDEVVGSFKKSIQNGFYTQNNVTSANSILAPTAIRYRLTLVVKADGVEHTGSSVVEISFYPPGLDAPMPTKVRGEAVTVDLGSRGLLFALLSSQGQMSDADKILLPLFHRFEKVKSYRVSQDVLTAASQCKDQIEISNSELPWLVRFRQLDDPKTVERVLPDDLQTSFGPGAKLVRAFLAVTHDPITSNIDQKLPWIADLNTRCLSLAGENPGSTKILARSLAPSQFKRDNR